MFTETLVKPNKLQQEKDIFFKWYNSNLNKIKKKVILNKININPAEKASERIWKKLEELNRSKVL